jgi:hypothetical protein
MDINVVLWILQIVLAVAFLGSAYLHALGYEQASTNPRMAWMQSVGPDRLRLIGFLELLGAIGLVLPAATNILPWLTPLAALALAVLMGLAAVFHLMRSGETMNAVFNIVIGLVAAFVAYGRFVLDPLP